MDKVAGSGNDEFYTPVYAITPLIKYLKDKGFKKILCQFDTKDSKIYNVLLSEGFEVEQSHLDDGVDFFKRTYLTVIVLCLILLTESRSI